MGDYHVHLHPHGPYDGRGPEPGTYPASHIDAYLDAAAGRGVDEICFTEHLYRCVESEDVLGRFWEGEPRVDLAEHTERFVRDDRVLSLDRYVDAVVAAKDRGLPVLLGLEVDFFPDTIGDVLDLLAPYPWDLLVGSVHWIGGWSYDVDDVSYEFERRGVRKAYEDYFALEVELAASGSVDVLAHVDAAKKTGYHLPEPPIDLYEPVVTAAAASGVAVEINTAGLVRGAQEIFPTATFLRMFREAGVPITLASDAHRPGEAGQFFDRAVELARSVGYTHSVSFRRRVPTEVPLPDLVTAP